MPEVMPKTPAAADTDGNDGQQKPKNPHALADSRRRCVPLPHVQTLRRRMWTSGSALTAW